MSQIENCGNFPGSPITVEGVPAGSLGAGVLGQAGCASVNGFMTGCYVRIGSNARNLSVVAHEIGHTLGMGHSERSDQLMSAFCCAPLGEDDVAGIQALYGARVAPTPTPTVPPPTATPVPPTATPIPAPVIYRRWLPGLARD